MPSYSFTSLDGEQTTDMYYPIKDAPKIGEIVEVEGVKWKRVFVAPRTASDTKIDPFSAKEFVEKTYSKKGETLGTTWDRSAELSAMRAEKCGGEDPVKKKLFEEHRKSRRGTPHPAELAENQRKAKEKLEKGLAKLGLKIDTSKIGRIS